MESDNEFKKEKGCIGLAVINILVFAYMLIIGVAGDGEYMSTHGAIYPPFMLEKNMWYPLFTAMFMHFDVRHLANNMIMLVAVGSYVERNMGTIRFLVLYLLAGLAGNILSFVNDIYGHLYTVSAGASGAVFGLVGALFALALKNRGNIEGLGARRILIMIIISLLIGFTSAGVDNVAHVGGLIAGFLLGFLLLVHRKPVS
ncbi:MAG: rhomboid family intramembrane serine protease [Lachnospiraceae bacterium]|nr:rhomboid family intramembrane serine protease [Lachnospiraceae bacterium]